MTLIHSTHRPAHECREHTLQGVFETRYAWLLRWALHFTDNDRSEAEDLVQETFVRLLLTWDTLRDLDDLEPLLYSYLRYAHLSERRRGRIHAFQRLSIADFDTLAMSLRGSSTFNQIEVQNEIREILNFLLWRRRSARFASMFILRFFHGYFPEEIASICISKRFAVDLGLSQARRELKAHLADPRQIHVLGRSPFPEQKPLNTAIQVDDFEDELRRSIFHSHDAACPPRDELDRHYNSLNLRSLETGLLAHIVSCECCLDKVARQCNAPPPSSRSMDDSFGRSPRGKSKKPGTTVKQRLARVFAEGQSRMREIYEHRPTGLMIALNAQVVAVRDLQSSASRAVLKVETRTIQSLEMIEVFSEQGLLLLAMPLLKRPPESQPEIRHEIVLSGERTLSLVVRFHGDGALIEAAYDDPQSAAETGDAGERSDEGAARDRFALRVDEPDTNSAFAALHGAWKGFESRLLSSIESRLRRVAPLIAAIATVAAVIFFIASMIENGHGRGMDANQVLRAAARAESNLTHTDQPAAISQRVQIKAAGRTVQRSLYRDVHEIRRPKETPMDEDERVLRARLAEANLDWNDPLSALNYRDWHDHLYREEDRVAETNRNLLTVSTAAEQGSIAEETLTVRTDDFHPVARTVRLRDGESIEIAELAYDIVPWGPRIELWFEPDIGTASSSGPPTAIRQSIARLRPNDAQLDVAELNVLLALQELHADTERLQVTRTPNGVAVKGIVESDDRKAEITARLHGIGLVIPAIASYRDLDSQGTSTGGVSQLQAVSVTAADSPLKAECDRREMAVERCRQISYALLDASTRLVRESKSMSELRVEYPPNKPLTALAKNLLTDLARQRLNHAHAALDEQERVMASLGVQGSRETENMPARTPFLEDAAQHNLRLCKQLVYVSEEQSPSAPVLLQELAESVGEARIALSHTAADFGAGPSLSSTFASPSQ